MAPGDGESIHLQFPGGIKPGCHDPLNFSSEGHDRVPLEFHPINSSRKKTWHPQLFSRINSILKYDSIFLLM